MKSNFLPIYANAAKLRASGNAYIVESLEKAGLKGIVPSHGDVLRHLFNKGQLFSCNIHLDNCDTVWGTAVLFLRNDKKLFRSIL